MPGTLSKEDIEETKKAAAPEAAAPQKEEKKVLTPLTGGLLVLGATLGIAGLAGLAAASQPRPPAPPPRICRITTTARGLAFECDFPGDSPAELVVDLGKEFEILNLIGEGFTTGRGEVSGRTFPFNDVFTNLINEAKQSVKSEVVAPGFKPLERFGFSQNLTNIRARYIQIGAFGRGLTPSERTILRDVKLRGDLRS